MVSICPSFCLGRCSRRRVDVDDDKRGATNSAVISLFHPVDRSTMKLCLATSLIVLATAASPAVAFTAGSSFVGGAKQIGSARGGASRPC